MMRTLIPLVGRESSKITQGAVGSTAAVRRSLATELVVNSEPNRNNISQYSDAEPFNLPNYNEKSL